MTIWGFGRGVVFAAALMVSFGLRAEPVPEPPLPEPVVRMIVEAEKSGNSATMDTVADVAKKAYPDSAAEIDHMVADLKASAEAAHLVVLQGQKFYQGWKGEGEIGASRSTGNTETTNVAVGLHLNKEGIKWRHKFNAAADYQHTRGVAGEDKYLAGYEANYKFSPKIFTFGLVQWERDRFAGFNNRGTESFGLGYSFIHTPKLTWDVTLGPAFRQIDQVVGPLQHDTEARLATQVAWRLTSNTVISEDASIYMGGGNNTYQSTTAVTTQIINALAARASFNIKKETSPSAGFKNTDTMSRVTLVYGF